MDGVMEAFYNVTIGDDLSTCWRYNQIVLWNIVDTVKYGFTDPFLAVVTFGLIMHKTPLVYKECKLVLNDIEYVDDLYTLYNNGPIQFAVGTHLME